MLLMSLQPIGLLGDINKLMFAIDKDNYLVGVTRSGKCGNICLMHVSEWLSILSANLSA